MKKVLNNKGMTLVEVLAAAVILAIVAAPLLMTIINVIQINLLSNNELKMNVAMQKILEEKKASNEYLTVDEYHYYDRAFNEITSPDPANDPKVVYMLKTTGTKNRIFNLDNTSGTDNTVTNYDRWDYLITAGNADGTNSYFHPYKNKEEIVDASGTDVHKENAYGKIWDKDELLSPVSGTDLNLTVKGIFTVASPTAPYSFEFKVGPISYYSEDFAIDENRGVVSGTNSSAAKYPIVINIQRASGTPPFNINLSNETIYNGDSSSTITDEFGNPVCQNSIILNIFDSEPYNEDNITINSNAPYSLYYYQNGKPVISNGQQIDVTVYEKNGNVFNIKKKSLSTIISN